MASDTPAAAGAPTDSPAIETRRPLAAKLPLVRVAKLDWNLRRFAFRDASQEGSVPLELAEVRLRNEGAIEILGEDPTSHPHLKLILEGAVRPIVGSFRVDLDAAPFAAEPTLEVAIAADGIRGQGITEVFPDLAAAIDGSSLTDGRLGAHLALTFAASRRGATGFDLSREFGGTMEVRDVAFRGGPDGPVLAGVDALEVIGLRVDPRTGALRIGAIEILTPRAIIVREKDGVRILDILVKLPQGAVEDEAPSPPEEVAEAVAEEEAPSPPEAVAETSAPTDPGPTPADESPAQDVEAASRAPQAGAEISLGKLVVSGIDLRVEDRSGDPTMVLPLEALEVEVRGISNRLLSESRQLRFSIFLAAGRVPLRKPLPADIVTGSLTDAFKLVTGGEAKEREMEERPFFGDVSANGQLVLFPKPTGWVRANVSGFELEGVRGPAAASGIALDGGALDASLSVNLMDGDMETRLRAILTDLTVSEPPDGPISRYLHLPAPLQTVVFALRNEGGEVKIPLGFSVTGGQVDGTTIAAKAVEMLGGLIARALASAPMRAAGGVLDVAGGVAGMIPGSSLLSFWGSDEPREETPISLEFAPGATGLSAAELLLLDDIIERLRDGEPLVVSLRHELGERDLERASVVANPSPEECLEMIAGLRRRREEILLARRIEAERVRVAYGVGLEDRAEEIRAEVARLDGELGDVEQSLDILYQRLRPGAERLSSRRTRDAAIAIGRDRIALIRDHLIKQLPDLASGDLLKVLRPQGVPVTGRTSGAVVVLPIVQKAQ